VPAVHGTYMHCGELAILIDLGTMHSRPGRAAKGRRTLPQYIVAAICGDKIHLASAGTLFVREFCYQKCMRTSVKVGQCSRHGPVQPANDNALFHPLSARPPAHNYTCGRGGPGDRSRQIERHDMMDFLAPSPLTPITTRSTAV
jgi:hypothetical protein